MLGVICRVSKLLLDQRKLIQNQPKSVPFTVNIYMILILELLSSTGASRTNWAIGYEEPARQAFGENHPEAAALMENCNVILKLWTWRQSGGQPPECRGRVVQMIQ